MTLNCKVCKSKAEKRFQKKLLKKYDVQYYFCPSCGYLSTENAYWLDEAYSSAISKADVGLVDRNINLSKKVFAFLNMAKLDKGKGLDLAGGTGLFVRLMRDLGIDFEWSDKYSDNVHAVGFEQSKDFYDVLTAFEAFEHLEEPMKFISESLSRFKPKVFIFTTELFDGEPPSLDWWYYLSETGQHISFYRSDTLNYIANQNDYKFYSNGYLHCFVANSFSSFKAFYLNKYLNKFLYFLFFLKRKTLLTRDHNEIIKELNENSI
jgi:hypothetical protein